MAALLSSDILEAQFGPTRLEILRQDDALRLIRTIAVASGQVLEVSRVTFEAPGVAAYPAIHQTVLAGSSMGKSFSEREVAFERQARGTYQVEAPRSFTDYFGVWGLATVVELSVAVGPEGTPYADILETYSPAVSWPSAANPATAAIAGQIDQLGKLLTSRGG